MSQLAEFIGNNLLLSLAFLAVFFLYLMLLMNEKMQVFANVNNAELTNLVNHKNAIVIDTRDSDSYKQGHIVNAINMPLNELVSGNSAINKFKGKTVIAYCNSGMSSKSACKHLIKSGVENVFNLSGGINGWIKDKLPTVKK
ncbi:MAG TPA: rhodanese-like domain-containing protein [Oceanospirillales bacterium]|nr:rhodanese-like domain-containing protein [Oceanospirillales bacterium]